MSKTPAETFDETVSDSTLRWLADTVKTLKEQGATADFIDGFEAGALVASHTFIEAIKQSRGSRRG